LTINSKTKKNAEFPVYLDCNATTPVDERVISKMMPFFGEHFGNASSSIHSFGWDAQEAVDQARMEIANIISATPREILFTSGATEAINLAIKGVVRRRLPETSHIITSVTEHPAVLQTFHALESEGTKATYLKVDSQGHIRISDLEKSITSNTALISLMSANNETGVTNSIGEATELAKSRGILFLSDITQTIGKLPFDVNRNPIDLATLSAHKIYGPKGIGALYICGGIENGVIDSQISGGGQEKGMRGGTLNVAGIVGFGEACRLASLEMEHEVTKIAALRDRLEASILANVPNAWINGGQVDRLPNTCSVGITGISARELIRDMYYLAIATTSACSSNSTKPSHVLKSLGLSDEQAYSCVRFSLGRFTTEEDINYAVSKIVESSRKLLGRLKH